MGQVQIKQVQEVVAAERAYALALLERAVRIQSGTHNHEGVRQVQALFAEELVKLGFTVTDIEHAHYADSLLATRSGKGLRILLVGHSDTVFETGSDTAFRLDTQKCHGQGTQDMKGGMVVMLSTLRALVKTDMLPDCRYTVFLNSHEEVGSVESANTLERLARGHDVALVLESAGKKGEYVCGRKGVLEYELQVRGVAGHAGNTVANRRSAVEELAYKIINLREWVANQEGMLFNAGVIQGGTRSNIIAEEACAELDIRYVTPQQRMAFE
ncbi:MAG TPA: M20/M25/M40 family metallo-hydrolase, partial [bacterium]|nr:M20/M25/M40 family metallo-hydrolase [bacterium]